MEKIKKTIFIFGGNGFIGTNLSIRLLNEGHTVYSFDNYFTSDENRANELMKKYENYRAYRLDITNKAQFDLLMYYIKGKSIVDEIYNLACPASPTKYSIDPLFTINTSLAIDTICRFAFESGAKLLHTSTSEIYGDPNVHPQCEEYYGNVNTIGPRSCYDEGKRIAETIMYEWRKKGVDGRIIRIFNTYGPYMAEDDGRVISTFICQVLRGENMTINGDGNQTRSFQYIDDLIDGMLLVMNGDEFGPFNIGNPDEYTINEISDIISDKIGGSGRCIYLKLPENDPKKRKPDINRMKEMFNWEPKVSLNEGIEKTIEYFKKQIGSQN